MCYYTNHEESNWWGSKFYFAHIFRDCSPRLIGPAALGLWGGSTTGLLFICLKVLVVLFVISFPTHRLFKKMLFNFCIVFYLAFFFVLLIPNMLSSLYCFIIFRIYCGVCNLSHNLSYGMFLLYLTKIYCWLEYSICISFIWLVYSDARVCCFLMYLFVLFAIKPR